MTGKSIDERLDEQMNENNLIIEFKENEKWKSQNK